MLLMLALASAVLGSCGGAGSAPKLGEITVSSGAGDGATGGTACHVGVGEEIFITVQIDNPEGFEISSLTISGKEYASGSFEKSSNSETIVVKITSVSSDGIFTYTADSIKYIEDGEVKSAVFDGERSVSVCVWDKKSVTASVSHTDVGTNSLSLSVNVSDEHGLVAFSGGAFSAVVYDGENAVAEKPLAVGDNTVTFDALKTDTEYRYAVISSCDLTGEGPKVLVLTDGSFSTDAVVTFENIIAAKDGASFDLAWHEDHSSSAITALKVYQGEVLVATLDTAAKSVGGLLSDNSYKLALEYRNGEQTERVYAEFKTLKMATPEISAAYSEKTQSSIDFTVTVTDEDNVGQITKIELVHKDGTVTAESVDVRSFSGLLSNNSYTVRVTYAYDLQNGKGEQALTCEFTTSTQRRLAPIFTVSNDAVTLDSVSAAYTLVDRDSVLSSYKIELYRGETLVCENNDKEISFSSLDYYTNYTVHLTYNYDLDDGAGVQTVVLKRNFLTLPYIDVTDCEITSSASVSVGEVIYMQASLDNPLNMTVESAVINGETYPVTMSSSGQITVNITHNDQFMGGDTRLVLESINAVIGSVSYSVEPTSEIYDSVFINGRPEVVEVEIVNSDFEPIDWAFPSDTVYVIVTIEDYTGYTVDSIKVASADGYESITSPTRLGDNKWYYETTLSAGWNERTPVSISYSSTDTERAVEYADVSEHCYLVTSDDVRYIRTANDLSGIEAGYYYELACDVDLAGLVWEGGAFNGVLNGCGYAIKNMTLPTSVKNADAYLGLFSKGTGVIENLNIKAATAATEIISDDGIRHTAHLGGLVGLAERLRIHNCTVDEASSLTLTNNSGGYSYVGGIVGGIGEIIGGKALRATGSKSSSSITVTSPGLNIYLGGMLGYADISSNLLFEDCENHGALTASTTSYTTYVGGIAGYTNLVTVIGSKNTAVIRGATAGGIVAIVARNTGRAIVIGCTNSGEIQANTESFTTIGAGIVAEMYGHTSIINSSNTADVYSTTKTGSAITGSLSGYMYVTAIDIIGCFNSGKVTSSRMITTSTAGGLAAHSNGVVTFKNSINCGLVDATTTGGLGGYAHGTLTMENNYSIFTAGTSNYNGIQLTVEQMNDKSFYTDVLGWSEDVWDFSELDIENGKCPILK